MKQSDIVAYSFVFVGLSIFAFNLVFVSMTGQAVFDIPVKIYQRATSVSASEIQVGKCSGSQAIAGMDSSDEPYLNRLSVYQQVCASFVTDTIVISTEIPMTEKSAEEAAIQVAGTLRELAAFGVKPIVLATPKITQGPMVFPADKRKKYDALLLSYFMTMRNAGVGDDMMGTWAPFPAANLPYWHHANIAKADYAVFVNSSLTSMKKIFPEAKGSILLSAATYEQDNFDWASGEYVSLAPYVSGIEKGLVDSFGIQGFPWAPPAESGRFGVFDAREYLNAKLAMEAAEKLGVKQIWFLSGVFSKKYTMDEDKSVTLDPGKRKDLLNGIISEVESTRKKGYTVTMALFTENRSNLVDATDWSYWEKPDNASNRNRSVFIDFVVKLQNLDIPFAVADAPL